MEKRFKPALACKVKDPAKNLVFPCIVSPKLDGIRALIINGQVVSRTLKLIPNKAIQRIFGHHALNGLDGELIAGKPTDPDVFRRTSSAVMSFEGDVSEVRFHVFDSFVYPEHTYISRLSLAEKTVALADKRFRLGKHLKIVPSATVASMEALTEIEKAYCMLGYEGLISRSPSFHYRQDRCTPKEQAIVKHKQFEDSEALIIGVIELQHNGNDKDESGKRTSHKAGKTGMATMGALSVRDVHTGVEFELGTGFTEKDRFVFWQMANSAIGNLVVKYKYFAVGVKDKPRHPVYLGLRNAIDM